MVVSSIHPPWRLQPWESYFFNFFFLRAEAPILWPPDAKGQLTGEDPDVGKDWRQKEKGVAEGDRAMEHHQLDGHEFEQTLGNSEGQRSLVCCGPWVCRVGHDLATEWWTQLIYLALLLGMWDTSSPTRDWTHAPWSGSTGLPGKSPASFLMPSRSRLPYPVGLWSSSTFIIPRWLISSTSCQSSVPDAHGPLHFTWTGLQPSGPCALPADPPY